MPRGSSRPNAPLPRQTGNFGACDLGSCRLSSLVPRCSAVSRPHAADSTPAKSPVQAFSGRLPRTHPRTQANLFSLPSSSALLCLWSPYGCSRVALARSGGGPQRVPIPASRPTARRVWMLDAVSKDFHPILRLPMAVRWTVVMMEGTLALPFSSIRRHHAPIDQHTSQPTPQPSCLGILRLAYHRQTRP